MTYLKAGFTSTPPNFAYDNFELPKNTSLNFRLQSHNSAADLPEEGDLREEMQSYDAIIVEGLTEPNGVFPLSKVAKGDTKTYTRLRDQDHPFVGWNRRMAAALYATRIKVTSIDIPAASRLVDEITLAQERYLLTLRFAETEDKALDHMPLFYKYSDALKKRDQLSLENLAPRLGALALPSEEASVLAIYGPAHWSLVDALAHKQTNQEVEGFAVRVHDDSDTVSLVDSMYGLRIRDMEIPEELYLRAHAATLIALGLEIGEYIDVQALPMSHIDALAIEVLGDKTYAEAHDVFKAMAEKRYTLEVPGADRLNSDFTP